MILILAGRSSSTVETDVSAPSKVTGLPFHTMSPLAVSGSVIAGSARLTLRAFISCCEPERASE